MLQKVVVQMKRIVAAIAAVIMIFSAGICFAQDAESAIKVMIGNKEITFDQGPVLIDGEPMIPMRAVFEEFGAFVGWDDDTQTATAIKDDTVIMIQIDNEKMFTQSASVELSAPAVLMNDRTLISLDAVEAAFDCDVQWNSEINEITIIKNNGETE